MIVIEKMLDDLISETGLAPSMRIRAILQKMSALRNTLPTFLILIGLCVNY